MNQNVSNLRIGGRVHLLAQEYLSSIQSTLFLVTLLLSSLIGINSSNAQIFLYSIPVGEAVLSQVNDVVVAMKPVLMIPTRTVQAYAGAAWQIRTVTETEHPTVRTFVLAIRIR